MPLHKKLVKGFLIYQSAAGAVQNAYAGFGLCQGLAVEYPAGLVGKRRVNGYEIRPGKQFIEGDVPGPQDRRHLRNYMRIIGKDLHFHCKGAVGHNRADIAQAYDAQGLVIKLRADKFLFFPLPVAH